MGDAGADVVVVDTGVDTVVIVGVAVVCCVVFVVVLGGVVVTAVVRVGSVVAVSRGPVRTVTVWLTCSIALPY